VGYLNAGILLERPGPDAARKSGAGMSFFESIREPEIREIFRYWVHRRYAAEVPAWHSISPADIAAKLLPNLFLYRLETDGRFRCKLIGTELCRVFGANETGRCLDAILPPGVARHRAGLFQHVLDTVRPIYYRGLAATQPGELRRYSRILMPLASSGHTANLVFGMALFGPLEELANTVEAESIYANPVQILYATEQDLNAPETGDLMDSGKATA